MHKTNKMSSYNPYNFSITMSLCHSFGESGLVAGGGPVMSHLEHSGRADGPTYPQKHNAFSKGHKNVQIKQNYKILK